MRQIDVYSSIRHYSLAVASVLTAALLRWVLTPVLGTSTIFILFVPMIALSAWYGGLGPGVAATVLAGVMSSFFLSSPNEWGLPDTSNLFSLVLFTAVGLFISVLNESLRRAQQQARQSAVELSETNGRFHLLVESVRDYGISMLDAQGRIVSWNSGAERITGYTEKEVIGRHFSIFYLPEHIASNRPHLELQIAAAGGHHEIEDWQVRKDGTRFWANVVIGAMRNTGGQVHGFSYVTQNLTSRKLAEEERTRLLVQEQEARSEAEAANNAKDEFLCVLSHELRTPLTAIIGWLGLLRKGVLPPDDVARALESLERSAHVQARLVEDLLDASHMIASQLPLAPHPMQLGIAVRGAIDAVRLAAESKGIALHVEAQVPDAWVQGDPVRLEQVFNNLLSNAIKFTPQDGAVDVCMNLRDSQVEVAVSDTGVGVSPSDLAVIFERFRQADSSETRHFSGLGLGLAIARYIVDAHGGSIRATSKGPGQGATFIVCLPLLTEP